MTCICVTPDGSRVVSCGRDAKLCIYDAVAVDSRWAAEEPNLVEDDTSTVSALASLVAGRMSVRHEGNEPC